MGEDIDVSTEAVERLVSALPFRPWSMQPESGCTLPSGEWGYAAVFDSTGDYLVSETCDAVARLLVEAPDMLRALAADRDAACAALTDAIAERDAAFAEVERLNVIEGDWLALADQFCPKCEQRLIDHRRDDCLGRSDA